MSLGTKSGKHSAFGSKKRYRSWLEDGWKAAVLALDDAKEVIGYGFLSYFGSRRDIGDFNGAYVVPFARRQGIFKQLLATTLETAKRMGMSSVVMFTGLDASHTKYLEAVGFQKSTMPSGMLLQFRRSIA